MSGLRNHSKQRSTRRFTARLLISLAVLVSACGSAPPRSEMPTHLLPATLPVQDGSEADQVLRVRVYAGAAYRARVMGWESELEQVVAASSAILQEACGTRLEMVENLDWKLSGANLEKSLKSLRSFDPATDVDLAIGLIDAAPTAAQEYGELLDADALGKHAVVRSYNRLAESEALGAAGETLDELTKDELLNRRRRHKQTLILVHAITKALGGSGGTTYKLDATKLDAEAAAILRVTVPATLAAAKPGAPVKSIWTAASGELASLGATAELVERARQAGHPKQGNQTSSTHSLESLRSVDRKTIAKVKELLKDSDASAAWERLEPLTELYPRQQDIVDLACLVAAARGAKDALERCKAAVVGNPKNGQAWLRVGGLQLKAQPTDALQSLRKAGSLMSDDSHGWKTLARAYQTLSLPSLALSAAQKVKNPKAVAKTLRWAQETRSRYGSNVGVDEDSEGRYLIAVKDGLKLVYKNDFKAASVAAADLASSFPKSIASDLMQCEIGVRRRKYAAAKQACQAVLAKQSENAWSRYLLGVVSLRERDQTKAIQFLAEAIARDPGLKAAYQALAKVYRKRSDTRLKALKAQYKEYFGAELK